MEEVFGLMNRESWRSLQLWKWDSRYRKTGKLFNSAEGRNWRQESECKIQSIHKWSDGDRDLNLPLNVRWQLSLILVGYQRTVWPKWYINCTVHHYWHFINANERKTGSTYWTSNITQLQLENMDFNWDSGTSFLNDFDEVICLLWSPDVNGGIWLGVHSRFLNI